MCSAGIDAQSVGDRGASEAPTILPAKHRDDFAAASPAVPDELRFIQDDAVEPHPR